MLGEGKYAWCGTYVEMTDGEISSFGNINGKTYPSSSDAWNACIEDMNILREQNQNARVRMIKKFGKIELEAGYGDFMCLWEIQKINVNEIEKEVKK